MPRVHFSAHATAVRVAAPVIRHRWIDVMGVAFVAPTTCRRPAWPRRIIASSR